MTDHGFSKWDYLSSVEDAKKTAKAISALSSVVSAHVVQVAMTDRDPAPKIGLIALCKGLRTKATFEDMNKKVNENISKSSRVSMEKLLIKFSYKNGEMMPPGKPHAFGCNMTDEPKEERP